MTNYYNLDKMPPYGIDNIKELIKNNTFFVLCFKSTDFVGVIKEEVRCEAYIEEFDINSLAKIERYMGCDVCEYISSEGESYRFIGLCTWSDAKEYITIQETMRKNAPVNEKILEEIQQLQMRLIVSKTVAQDLKTEKLKKEGLNEDDRINLGYNSGIIDCCKDAISALDDILRKLYKENE